MYRSCSRRAKYDDDGVNDGGEFTHIQMKNADNLGRDIRVRMECLIISIKMIQLDLELLQRNDGIVSLEALHSVGVIDFNYYRHFTGPDNEQV